MYAFVYTPMETQMATLDGSSYFSAGVTYKYVNKSFNLSMKKICTKVQLKKNGHLKFKYYFVRLAVLEEAGEGPAAEAVLHGPVQGQHLRRGRKLSYSNHW